MSPSFASGPGGEKKSSHTAIAAQRMGDRERVETIASNYEDSEKFISDPTIQDDSKGEGGIKVSFHKEPVH